MVGMHLQPKGLGLDSFFNFSFSSLGRRGIAISLMGKWAQVS
jgi:hypothetical protein